MNKAVGPGVAAVLIVAAIAIVGYFAWRTLGPKPRGQGSEWSTQAFQQKMEGKLEQQRRDAATFSGRR